MQASSIRQCKAFRLVPPSIARLKAISSRLGRISSEGVPDIHEIEPALIWLSQQQCDQYMWARVELGAISFQAGITKSSRNVEADLFSPVFAELPEEIRIACVTQAFEPLLKPIADILGSSITFAEWSSGAPMEGWKISLERNVKEYGDYNGASIVIAADTDDLLTDLLTNFPISPIELNGKLAVPLSLEYGWTTLTVSELQSMVLGDLVLMSHPHTESSRITPTLVVSNSICIRGSVVNGAFEIRSFVGLPRGISMSDQLIDGVCSPVATEGLELQVTATCGTYSASIKDISTWKSGSVVSLGVPIDSDRITLMVGQQAIARGRLVGLGENFGVEITDLFIK
jgi:type III secretion system YscQ/HrcQ family protein